MQELDAQVDRIVAEYTKELPGWVRVVVWVGRLAEPDGSPAEANVTVHRVLSWDGERVTADYGRGHGARQAFRDIDEATADRHWTELRIEVDRDGQRKVDLVTDQPMRAVDNSATDPHWRQVHDYLELHQTEVEALVERLRANGNLPGEAAPAEQRRGILGYFRRDG